MSSNVDCLETEIEVKEPASYIMLRLADYSQTVRLGGKPLEAHD
jgi:hypothetical protein